ncbi:MAG: hypothetical protein IT372_04740 [Polyangiaceae bacterium]|nr:hypothetical protein [Polyangiaceae bacterium]
MRPSTRARLASAAALSALLAATPAEAAGKYALSMFHFNVQYVAGGMVGYFSTPDPAIDLDADAIEDLIITESLAPVIDLFARHPGWGADIEMQAYTLDVLAARHPAVLDTLRALAKSGQISVVSFHYSDQLFIAYPEEDWERSQALAAATFEAHDVPLARSVFCQEGQAGPALAARLVERGYQTMVWPKNLWTYQQGDFDAAPLYRFGGALLVVGAKGVEYHQDGVDVSVTWTFLDDGELLATNDMNPYLPDEFRHDPAAVAEYEDSLAQLEAEGFEITTVDKYVAAVKDVVPLADPPPLLDGTWQPNSTEAVKRWLGGGGLWGIHERDNHVRTLGALAHRELVLAEALAARAGLDAKAALDSGFRMLALGQVSDASGINPFRGEIEYGIAHLAESLRIARDVITEAKAALGADTVTIDSGSGEVIEEAAPEPEAGQSEAPQIALEISPDGRPVTETWELLAPGHHRVTIEFGAGDSRFLGVRFPGGAAGDLSGDLVITDALADGVIATYSRADFAFEDFYLALPTGLVSLGPGRFLVKDQARVHLAAQIFRDSLDVAFTDETAPAGEPQTWVFHVLDGTADEALALAHSLNVTPRLSR